MNLLAFSGFPRGRKSQLDLIPEDVKAFKAAVRKAKLAIRPQELCFLIQGEDRKGAVAEVLGKLADRKVNVVANGAVSAGSGPVRHDPLGQAGGRE